MKSLIVGFGSIGKRHAAILKAMGCEAALLTQQTVLDYVCFTSLKAALKEKWDNIIIANETSLHYPMLLAIIQENFTGTVLVEKPLFANYSSIPTHQLKSLLVAYPLRFNPILLYLRTFLKNQKLISCSVHTGQYLPDWRPGSDYQLSYSASTERGGGVLRDLSHEFDYTCWLLGKPHSLAALGGQWSALSITSEDVYTVLMKSAACPLVTIHLNYLNRVPQRELVINTEQHTIFADLLNGILKIDGTEKKIELTDMYKMQLQALINQDYASFCSAEEGLFVTSLIEKIEKANLQQTWVTV